MTFNLSDRVTSVFHRDLGKLPEDWKKNASRLASAFTNTRLPELRLEYGEYPYVSNAEVKQALKLKAAFGNMLDQMQ